ncbi:MAG: hypothetical protein J6I60_01490 [Bacteroidaceae bacterium]|nr:hypothetical protein [Bacteroidaceae bacterium]
MKKVILGMFIALVSICMVSCQSGGIDKAKEIMKELKEKGASMDKAQLKEKMLAFLDAVKPVVEKFKTALNGAKDDPTKALEVMQGKDFQEFSTLMQDMSSLEEIPAMKELEDDPDLKKAAAIFDDM